MQISPYETILWQTNETLHQNERNCVPKQNWIYSTKCLPDSHLVVWAVKIKGEVNRGIWCLSLNQQHSDHPTLQYSVIKLYGEV